MEIDSVSSKTPEFLWYFDINNLTWVKSCNNEQNNIKIIKVVYLQ